MIRTTVLVVWNLSGWAGLAAFAVGAEQAVAVTRAFGLAYALLLTAWLMCFADGREWRTPTRTLYWASSAQCLATAAVAAWRNDHEQVAVWGWVTLLSVAFFGTRKDAPR